MINLMIVLFMLISTPVALGMEYYTFEAKNIEENDSGCVNSDNFGSICYQESTKSISFGDVGLKVKKNLKVEGESKFEGLVAVEKLSVGTDAGINLCLDADDKICACGSCVE